MEQLTIRDLPTEVFEALERESVRQRKPLENTVVDLLRQALRLKPVHTKKNGLARLAGTWTEEEYRSFEAFVAITEEIDEDHFKAIQEGRSIVLSHSSQE